MFMEREYEGEKGAIKCFYRWTSLDATMTMLKVRRKTKKAKNKIKYKYKYC